MTDDKTTVNLDLSIAVLIPCYNAETYLAECLDSALRQTYPQIEIFCCDDGSMDGTRRILAEYAARYPNIHVTAQENRGVSATRNRLMDELPEDIDAFAFLDADDTVAPEAYATLAEALVRTGADVAEMGGPPGGRVIDDMSIYLLRKTAPGAWINCINKLYRRSAVGDVRFRLGLSFEEDFFFNYEINAKIRRKVLVPGKFYAYRNNPHSATSVHDPGRYLESVMARIRLSSVEFLEAGRIPIEKREAFRRELAKDAYRMCIRKNLKKNHDARRRRELFLRASNFFAVMEREHGFKPIGLNPMQRLLYACCLHRFYACARAVSVLV